VRGEVTVLLETDDRSRFAPGSVLTTDSGRELVVVSASPYRDKGLIVGFDGVIDREQAEALRGEVVGAPVSTRRDLADGEFWPDDLVGLDAVERDGTVLGVVAAIDFGDAQDRLVIRTPAGREVLVPFVDDIVGDPADGTIEIRDPGGLF